MEAARAAAAGGMRDALTEVVSLSVLPPGGALFDPFVTGLTPLLLFGVTAVGDLFD